MNSQAKLIYDTNKQAINFLLMEKGYQQTFDGLLQAIEDIGDGFLVELYNEIALSFSQAEGNFWTKFKNIFHKAVGIIDKTGTISGGVDNLINKDKSGSGTTTPIPTNENKWQPNLLLWGGGALALIIILIIIYAYKK